MACKMAMRIFKVSSSSQGRNNVSYRQTAPLGATKYERRWWPVALHIKMTGKARKINGFYFTLKTCWFIILWIKTVFCPPGREGVLDLSLGRGCRPKPWNPGPVYDKKFVFTIFRSNFSHFCVKLHYVQTLFLTNLRKSANSRPCLWSEGQKTIPGRAGPHIAYLWEYPPPPPDYVLHSWTRYETYERPTEL